MESGHKETESKFYIIINYCDVQKQIIWTLVKKKKQLSTIGPLQ